jgi:hypothetical protein
VGQDETTKKKSSETANNRLAQGSSGGSTRLSTQISSGGAVCHRLRAAPEPTRVSWAPALASRCRTTPGAPRVTGSEQHPPLGADQLRGHYVSPAHGSSGTGTCLVGSSTRLLTQDNSGSAACPHSSGAGGKTSGRVTQKQSSERFFLAPAARHRAAPRAPRVPAASARMKTVKPMQKT